MFLPSAQHRSLFSLAAAAVSGGVGSALLLPRLPAVVAGSGCSCLCWLASALWRTTVLWGVKQSARRLSSPPPPPPRPAPVSVLGAAHGPVAVGGDSL